MRQLFSILLFTVSCLFPVAAGADAWEQFLGAARYCPAERVDIWPELGRQWQRIISLEKANPVFSYPGRARLPEPYIRHWRNLMQKFPAMSQLQKLRAISAFVNVQLNGSPDRLSYGLGEYWAAPAEFIANHGGDCEDFAICKYFALRALGVKSQELRLLIVEIPSRRAWHMLLAMVIEGKIYIVDNNFRPADLALPQERLKGFFVLHFALNEDEAWFYKN